MKQKRYSALAALGGAVALAVALTLLGAAPAARSQGEQAYTLLWGVVGGGGISASADSTHLLNGTVGQFDAGQMSGGEYAVSGGVWHRDAPTFSYYFPLIGNAR